MYGSFSSSSMTKKGSSGSTSSAVSVIVCVCLCCNRDGCNFWKLWIDKTGTQKTDEVVFSSGWITTLHFLSFRCFFLRRSEFSRCQYFGHSHDSPTVISFALTYFNVIISVSSMSMMAVAHKLRSVAMSAHHKWQLLRQSHTPKTDWRFRHPVSCPSCTKPRLELAVDIHGVRSISFYLSLRNT